jgi:LPS sulfotransferase NodH
VTDLDPRWGTPSPLHDPYALANFQARPTDVLIVTAPKAGSTWMQQILHQMRTGGDPDFGSIFEVVPWLELPSDTPWQERLAAYERIHEPRVFKTHCNVAQTPGVEIARIVVTMRDPRECCVSMFHHVNGITEEAAVLERFDSMQACVDLFLEFGAWYWNVKDWWQERERENLRLFRYAVLKADLGAAVDELSRFLGWPLAPEARARVLEYSSFPWMKAHSDKFTRMSTDGPQTVKEGQFIRKGEVGRAEEELTPAQSEAILARARAELEPECLRWLGIN